MLTVWQHLLDRVTASAGVARFPTPGDLAAHLNPKNVRTPALELIDQALVDLMNTPDGRLIITMPPQEGKSLRVAGDFPAWALLQQPDWRIITASYGQRLADRNGRAIRRRIQNHPELGLTVAKDHGAVSEWSIEGHEGGVYSVGIGGSVTGQACDLMIIDDPVKSRAEAESETIREHVWDWWTDEASSRFGAGARAVLIMTRWHADDLAGRLVEKDADAGWRVLNIPAQADHNPADGGTDPLGREPGEFMVSARGRTHKQWEQRKKTAGSRGWQALYQGDPAPPEGALFKRSWWRRYDQPLWIARPDGTRWTSNPGDQVIISADFTFKDTADSDYIAIGVWLRRGPNVYLLDQIRDRRDFLGSCDALRELAARWPQAALKLVEDKANGTAVINTLSRLIPGIVPEEPKGGKVERAHATVPFVEAGNVWLPTPELCPWIGEYVEELAAFPTGKNDDQCLVGETLVTTPSGDVRLDTIRTGDLVLGASGWVKVLAAGQTGAAPVIERFGIVGTAAHPIWTENRGWQGLSQIRYDDVLWINASHAANEKRESRAKAGACPAISAGGNSRSHDRRPLPLRAASSLIDTVVDAASRSLALARAGSATPAGWNATLSEWRKSSTEGSSSADIPTRETRRTASTTSRAAAISLGESKRSTGRFTRTHTARFLSDITFITSTRTPRTTTRTISWHSLLGSMSRSLLPVGKREGGPGEIAKRCLRTLMRSALRLQHGTALRTVGDGTGRTPTGIFPVYNLTTSDGTYFANGVLTHNCDQTTQAVNRLLLSPYLDMTDDVEPDEFAALDEQGFVYSPY